MGERSDGLVGLTLFMLGDRYETLLGDVSVTLVLCGEQSEEGVNRTRTVGRRRWNIPRRFRERRCLYLLSVIWNVEKRGAHPGIQVCRFKFIYILLKKM